MTEPTSGQVDQATLNPHSTAPSLVETVDDDCLIAIFQYLYLYCKVEDAIRLLQTCTKTRNLFSSPTTGKPHYVEAKAKHSTRMPVRVDECFPYTRQWAREERSKKRAAGFYKACEMLAMHCATDCCKPNRDEFNRYYSKKFCRVDTVATGVRLVASAAEKPVHFIYCRERDACSPSPTRRSRKSTHISVIRKSGADGNVLDIDQLTVVKLVPSPDGRYCAFIAYVGSDVAVYVWDTHRTGSCNESRCQLQRHKRTEPETWPQCVWWARTTDGVYTLFAAWNGQFFDETGVMVFRSTGANPPPLHVVDYGTLFPFDDANIVQAITRFTNNSQRIGTMHGVGCDLAIFFTISATEGIASYNARPENCFNLMIVDCNAVRTPLYAMTFNPARLYPPQSLNEERDVVHMPITLAMSPNGGYIAVLAQEFKWRSTAYPTEGGRKSIMSFVLYTYDEKLNSFVKKLGPRDEIAILTGPTQERHGWEATFSPCGSYVALVYARNRYKPRRTVVDDEDDDDDRVVCNVAESAVHIIHISPTGLRKSKTVDCPQIRQLAWTEHALLVSPKHGAVQLR